MTKFICPGVMAQEKEHVRTSMANRPTLNDPGTSDPGSLCFVGRVARPAGADVMVGLATHPTIRSPVMADDRLIIFDTTLRDGEQSPGASMNLSEKLEVAHALKELGVDVIEAGFPIASPGDFESVQAIARQVVGPVICGLARCNPEDIDRAGEAVRDAARPRIHVFLATSAIHREFKLRMAKEEILRRAIEAVKRAKD